MTTPTWEAGTLYQPGALVVPRSLANAAQVQPIDPSFESGGLTNWSYTTSGGAAVLAASQAHTFQGSWSLFHPGANGSGSEGGVEASVINNRRVAVVPGQAINGSAYFRYNVNGFTPGSRARTRIYWFDSGSVQIGFTEGTLLFGSGAGTPSNGWVKSDVQGVAPPGAAFASIGCWLTARDAGDVFADSFSWDYIATTLPAGLVFQAVQTNAGYSGSSEPAWPTVNGLTVVDNEVTWEAVFASRITWEASPILVSGEYEPEWPTSPGASARDGTIVWVCMDHRIKDEKCPQSKVVTIGASKVFAADGDIIAFCATVNPLDWSTEQDAGFIPFGLQAHGGSGCEALGLYNSNLAAFSERGYQIWQIDEDPANMALLDAKPVDCRYHLSLQPISNDLLFLSSQGIRNIGTAGATGNMQAGWFGKQIDPLVLAALRELEDANPTSGLEDSFPLGLYWPGAGQYWLFFGDQAFVLTMNGGPKDMSWSRYVFPYAVDDWTILDGELYLRTGDLVWRVSDEAIQDDEFCEEPALISPLPEYVALVQAEAAVIERTADALTIVNQGGGGSGISSAQTVGSAWGTRSWFNAGTATEGQHYLSLSHPTSRFVFPGAFTIEGWFYPTAFSDLSTSLFGNNIQFPLANFWVVSLLNSGTLFFGSNFANHTTAAGIMTLGSWHHVALVRNASNNWALFVNGVRRLAVSSGGDLGVLEGGFSFLSIGKGISGNPGDNGDFNGYIDDFRALKGLAAYDPTQTTLVVPTGPFAPPVTALCTDVGLQFEGRIWWPYLDFGALGKDKTLESFDLVCDGTARVTFGYNQRNSILATPEQILSGDNLPEDPVPVEATAPSFQFRLEFDGNQTWEWFAAGLHIS